MRITVPNAFAFLETYQGSLDLPCSTIMVRSRIRILITRDRVEGVKGAPGINGDTLPVEI